MLNKIDWREAFPVQSIIRKPSLGDLLDFDPLMLTSYIIIGGTGLFAIGMARLEKKLTQKDDDDRAALVGIIAKSILMSVGIAGAIYYIIIKNPLWRFF